jgi:hypothetical protein
MIISISDKSTAIRSLVPESEVSIYNDVVTWHKPTKSPVTNEEIQAEMDRLQAEYDAQAYARSRKAEYDALNQLEMQYDDEEDGTTTWKDAIVAIKTKYPKV